MANRIYEFDLWRPGYGGAVVSIYLAGTTNLASVFTDEALSVAAPNPQTLSSMAAPDGTRFGKFSAPLYIGASYELSIDGIENTGVVRPSFSSLSAEDASAATVIAAGSSYALALSAIAAQEVNVANFGVFVEGSGGVAATNTATMELAIAAVSSGGYVNVPSGLYKVNDFDVPEGVVIRGQGIDATTLESILGAESFTIVGNDAGFSNITLDGNSLSSGSIGIKSENRDRVVFQSVKIKRFETGMYFYGGSKFVWFDLSIENTVTAANLFGEDNVLKDVTWYGGLVSVATTLGINMSYEDEICHNITFIGVGFEDCTDYSSQVNGAQNISFINCWWENNTKIINILDDTAVLTPATEADNDVINVQFNGGRMDAGDFTATGVCQNVILRNMKIKDVDFQMTTPILNFIVLENCFEESGVTITGETAKLLRATSSQNGSSFGITTAATATKAWGLDLKPGQQAYLEAKVIAKGRNVVESAMYHIGCGVLRPGSTLNYDTQTSNFTNGAIVTGASSGATARIQDDSDSGTTGTLTLTDISGEFIDNEIIDDDDGTPGSAQVNGVLTHVDSELDTTGNIDLRTLYETTVGFAAAFVVNGSEIELQVTGAASMTLEWTVHVDVVST